MQRSINYTRVHYATIETDDNGKFVVVEKTINITETDPRKVKKELEKGYINPIIISTKKFSQLYVMPDSDFFAYAEPVGDPKEIVDEH